MEREERVRRYYELVDAGDVAELVALFSPKAVYRRPGYDPLVGRRALERFYRSQRVIKKGRHTLATVLMERDGAAVHGSFAGTLHDGSEVSLRFADFFTFSASGAFRTRDTFFFTPLV
ncbi:nuclear transport factor 2 family protein [Streptomyces atrovirens]|uniref:Nuclear transport factor 2 family protein n=1 Tax=Streptomyces atrovirens TaxID=285556 RepID=A0ABW0DYU9_9ACTN